MIFTRAIPAATGYSSTLQCSSDPNGPWATLTNLTAAPDGLLDVEDPTEPTPPVRFYRVAYP